MRLSSSRRSSAIIPFARGREKLDNGVLFTLPERCRPFVRPSTGKWNGAFLDLPQGEARKFSLTWTWPDTPELPELSEAWLLAHTAATESTENNEVDEAEGGQENSEAGETSTPDAE